MTFNPQRQHAVCSTRTAWLPDFRHRSLLTVHGLGTLAPQEARNARKAGLRSEYTKSSKVFAKLQDQQVATASGRGAAKAQPGDGRPAALLKL